MNRTPLRLLLALLGALTLLATLPAAAGAVLGGENGRIIFISGRDADNDAQSRPHLLPVFSSTGGGTVGQALAAEAGQQYRHPTWSPDRTKIAYARGIPNADPALENFDIFIHDIQSGMVTPITNTGDSLSADRPAWSPDGTRIAYEHQPTDGSTERDIRVHTLANGALLDLTTGAPHESKPAWTPDSQEIWYTLGNPNTASGIYKEAANGSSPTPITVIDQGGVSEFQASLSPDGTKFCFTIGTGFNSTANIIVGQVATPLTGQVFLADEPTVGEYNCTWSPDGFSVAYVSGIFSTGRLMMERADNSSPSAIELTQDPGANNFDGNPDWAPDGRPACAPMNADILVNTTATITANCPDQGPAYELTPVKVFVRDDPTNGTATGDVQDAPGTFVYTPNANFVGTDTFTVGTFDDYGFGENGTATIRVLRRGACANPQVGTNGPNLLNGTRFGDRLRGRGGSDRLNGLAGNDCLDGGRGRDRLNGGNGNDVLVGGPGRNTYAAGAGNDRVNARNGVREAINCGKGRRDRAVLDRSDRARGCERITRR